MEEEIKLLSNCPLFEGIDPLHIQEMLACLNAQRLSFQKGQTIFFEGQAAQTIGVVLNGNIQILHNDFYGRRSVLAVLEKGEVFGEAFVCAGLTKLPVSVVAQTHSTVLFLNGRHALATPDHPCPFHHRLIFNLLQDSARKNLLLTKKIQCMSQKNTQAKLLEYLTYQAREQQSNAFTIPYQRQELADYLGVERSALSNEISKLKKAGYIDTKGSWFCLYLGQNEKQERTSQ